MPINPYESPSHPSERRAEPSPWWMQGVQFCGLAVATSVALGGLANVLNGWVCPEYFMFVMHWDPDSNIWLRAILQGMLEGFVIGVVLSVAFFGIGSLLTRFRLTFARAARYLVAIVIAAVISAVVLGLILTTDIRGMVLYSPDEVFSLQFGWVAGCISGLERGGAFAALVALIVLVVRDWRKMHRIAADAKNPSAD
jgi:hypothetical protein